MFVFGSLSISSPLLWAAGGATVTGLGVLFTVIPLLVVEDLVNYVVGGSRVVGKGLIGKIQQAVQEKVFQTKKVVGETFSNLKYMCGILSSWIKVIFKLLCILFRWMGDNWKEGLLCGLMLLIIRGSMDENDMQPVYEYPLTVTMYALTMYIGLNRRRLPLLTGGYGGFTLPRVFIIIRVMLLVLMEILKRYELTDGRELLEGLPDNQFIEENYYCMMVGASIIFATWVYYDMLYRQTKSIVKASLQQLFVVCGGTVLVTTCVHRGFGLTGIETIFKLCFGGNGVIAGTIGEIEADPLRLFFFMNNNFGVYIGKMLLARLILLPVENRMRDMTGLTRIEEIKKIISTTVSTKVHGYRFLDEIVLDYPKIKDNKKLYNDVKKSLLLGKTDFDEVIEKHKSYFGENDAEFNAAIAKYSPDWFVAVRDKIINKPTKLSWLWHEFCINVVFYGAINIGLLYIAEIFLNIINPPAVPKGFWTYESLSAIQNDYQEVLAWRCFWVDNLIRKFGNNLKLWMGDSLYDWLFKNNIFNTATKFFFERSGALILGNSSETGGAPPVVLHANLSTVTDLNISYGTGKPYDCVGFIMTNASFKIGNTFINITGYNNLTDATWHLIDAFLPNRTMSTPLGIIPNPFVVATDGGVVKLFFDQKSLDVTINALAVGFKTSIEKYAAAQMETFIQELANPNGYITNIRLWLGNFYEAVTDIHQSSGFLGSGWLVVNAKLILSVIGIYVALLSSGLTILTVGGFVGFVAALKIAIVSILTAGTLTSFAVYFADTIAAILTDGYAHFIDPSVGSRNPTVMRTFNFLNYDYQMVNGTFAIVAK